MQAIDEITSKKIVVPLVHLSQEEKTQFQPTSSQGVSFLITFEHPRFLLTLVNQQKYNL